MVKVCLFPWANIFHKHTEVWGTNKLFVPWERNIFKYKLHEKKGTKVAARVLGYDKTKF